MKREREREKERNGEERRRERKTLKKGKGGKKEWRQKPGKKMWKRGGRKGGGDLAADGGDSEVLRLLRRGAEPLREGVEGLQDVLHLPIASARVFAPCLLNIRSIISLLRDNSKKRVARSTDSTCRPPRMISRIENNNITLSVSLSVHRYHDHIILL